LCVLEGGGAFALPVLRKCLLYSKNWSLENVYCIVKIRYDDYKDIGTVTKNGSKFAIGGWRMSSLI
jgi:hypothetical protein